MNNEPEKPVVRGWEDVEDAALERDLSAALRPLKLPDRFADRLLARVEAQGSSSARPRAKVIPFRAWRLMAGGAIAAMLIGGVFAAQDLHQRHEHERRQAVATQQFETATRITDQVLAHTREELARSGAFSGD